jgi:hypothetical protein
MRCRGLLGVASAACLSRFLFCGLPSVAPYCVPGGVRVVSTCLRKSRQDIRTAPGVSPLTPLRVSALVWALLPPHLRSLARRRKVMAALAATSKPRAKQGRTNMVLTAQPSVKNRSGSPEYLPGLLLTHGCPSGRPHPSYLHPS